MEIGSVQNRSHVEMLGNLATPLKLRGVIRGTKCDVMHRAGARHSIVCIGIDKQVDVIAERIPLSGKTNPAALLFCHFVESHEIKNCSCRLRTMFEERDSVKAAN